MKNTFYLKQYGIFSVLSNISLLKKPLKLAAYPYLPLRSPLEGAAMTLPSACPSFALRCVVHKKVKKTHVANVCFKCLRCFKGMLQVFYADDAIVDRVVAYVAMVVHVCCKLLFTMFHLFSSRRMLQACLFGCCIYFTYMLQVFYLDVAFVLQRFSCVFASVSDTYCKYFI
jgi:hypothetical protein